MPRQVPELLLGLDIGSSRIKALLLDAEGGEAGVATVTTPFGRGESATELGVADLVGAVAEALAQLGPRRRRVVGMGIAGMAESGSPLDSRGRPLAPVIAWHDPRGAEVADRLVDHFGPPLALRIGRAVRPVSSVAKLGWLVDHGVAGTAGWLGVPELCLDALTGSRATEFSLAACSGCWDVTGRKWLGEVAEVAGFDVTVLPRVLPAGRVMGRVSAAAASWSGLEPETPVTIAGHDHLVAALGAGAAARDLVNSVGTAETVLTRMAERPDVAAALERRLAVGVTPGGEGWALLAGAARAGLAVASAARTLGRAPEDLDALAAASGTPAPPPSPALLESLRKREPPHLPTGSDAEVWATLLAALATCTAEAVDRVSGLVRPPARMVVVGGGAASRVRLEATARAVALPVWRSRAGEAAARGAAAFAGVAAGWWPSADAVPGPALEEVTPGGSRTTPASGR